jgi:type II secretory pathway pseudopilin PulG
MNCRRRTGAFTLIELIMVMALLTAVFAIAAPSLSNFFRGRVLNSEARRLLAMTRYGQSRAASEGIPMVLWIDPDEGRYGLQQAEGYEEFDPKQVEYQLSRDLEFELRSERTLTQGRTNFAERFSVRFQPDGSIAETSLRSITLVQKEMDFLVITQSQNRLAYEISPQTNNFPRR